MKVFMLALMVASAMALPADPYAAKLPPKPFAYQYGVKDDYSGTTFDKAETQDDYGNVKGEYKVQLPDGRIQIVSYTADHDNGFVAEVRYDGVPQYPPSKPKAYGPPPPKYTN